MFDYVLWGNVAVLIISVYSIATGSVTALVTGVIIATLVNWGS